MFQHDLLPGEYVQGNPPVKQLNSGEMCVPQHYLSYNHTLESVEALILSIEYNENYPIFVSEDNAGIYIQIGIVGVDNYKVSKPTENKIVYGRKWRVEPNLPTSEIIQTVFLALKIAREHEVRELFQLQVLGKTTTPFNNHHDLPLLTKCANNLQVNHNAEPCHELTTEMKKIRYAKRHFSIHSYQKIAGESWLVELALDELALNEYSDESLPELSKIKFISFIISSLKFNSILHGLITALISLSDRYVEENFRYQGIARFSQNLDVSAIATLSAETRQLHKNSAYREFLSLWLQNNYETDLTRIPEMKTQKLTKRITQQLASFGDLTGFPIERKT